MKETKPQIAVSGPKPARCGARPVCPGFWMAEYFDFKEDSSQFLTPSPQPSLKAGSPKSPTCPALSVCLQAWTALPSCSDEPLKAGGSQHPSPWSLSSELPPFLFCVPRSQRPIQPSRVEAVFFPDADWAGVGWQAPLLAHFCPIGFIPSCPSPSSTPSSVSAEPRVLPLSSLMAFLSHCLHRWLLSSSCLILTPLHLTLVVLY